jgi:hypothetical protein
VKATWVQIIEFFTEAYLCLECIIYLWKEHIWKGFERIHPFPYQKTISSFSFINKIEIISYPLFRRFLNA